MGVKKMRVLNFNIRFGGEKRNSKIVDYLLNNDFDMIMLTDFIKNDNGQEIIAKLVDKGYTTQPFNEKSGMESFIACKDQFVIEIIEDRWVEIYIPKMDLYVLGVCIPDGTGTVKSSFWEKILDYAQKNIDKKVLITGDFNTRIKVDSSNITEYDAENLLKLEDLGYLDLWKYNSANKLEGYSCIHYSVSGFRLEYAFVSPKLIVTIEDVSVYSDLQIRESKITDQTPLVVI